MSHVWIVVYTQVGSTNVGRIRRRVRVREESAAVQAFGAGESALTVAFEPHQSTHYITSYYLYPQVSERPAATATIDKTTVTADGTDTVTVSGLTDATDTVLVVGPNGRTTVTPSGGSVALQFDTPGTYIVHAIAFPKLRSTWAVTAT